MRKMEGRGGGERGNSVTQSNRERLSRSLNKQQREDLKGLAAVLNSSDLLVMDKHTNKEERIKYK